MPTVQEKVRNRLIPQKRKALNWGTVIAALNGATQLQKDTIIGALAEHNIALAAKVINTVIFDAILADADASAAQMLADGKITEQELDSILP